MEYVLSLWTLITMGVNLLMAVVVPIVLYAVFRGKFEGDNRAFLAGCSTMIAIGLVVQMLINYFFLPTAVGQFIYSRPWLYALFMGLVAALIHEPGRYLCIKLFLRDEIWNDHNALIFGAGYGSVSILASALMSTLVNFLMVRMILSGQVDYYLENLTGDGLAAAKDALTTLCNTPASTYLLYTVEQLLVIADNIALSVLIWFAVQGGPKRRSYLLMAMAVNFLLQCLVIGAKCYASSFSMVQVFHGLLTVAVIYVAAGVWKKEYKPLDTEVQD